MSRTVDPLQMKFGPLRDKGLKNALAHAIGRDFPRIGGLRIRQFCAQMILEVVEAHVRPREAVRHGQALWLGVDVNDPPSRGKRTAETHLIPVVLDVSTDEDIEARLDRRLQRDRTRRKAIRLCKQAYAQGALLSNCDLAELLNTDANELARLLAAYERDTGRVIPRRATLHDIGSGLTHKRIICRKRYAQGKSSEEIARETYHTVEAVDRYLGQFDRVRHCQRQGMGPAETAYTLHCSRRLVEDYLEIDRALEGPSDDHTGTSARKDGRRRR